MYGSPKKKPRFSFWVIRFGYRQLWRLTLVVFLLSLSLSTLWQLMLPPQYLAHDLASALTPSFATTPTVQWQWSELLVQGFPWLRSAAPVAFQEPWDHLKRLLGLCFGFVPGDTMQTLRYGLPWLREALVPVESVMPHVAVDQVPQDTNSTKSVIPAMESTANFSLLPMFSPAEILALEGDLAPAIQSTSGDNATGFNQFIENRTTDKPPVLIFHTHNAEAYEASGDARYVYNNDDRTVIHVGDVLQQKLEALGVPVVHNTTHHMDANFNLAYVQARRSLQRELADQPFSMVLDLHNDGTRQEITTCDIGGQSLARLLLVLGKAEGIGTSWKLNESFAQAMHQGLQQVAPGLSRGLYYEAGVRYNQDVHPAALIIEVGGNENSLEEALRSTEYLAQVLADLYFNGW